MCFFGRNNREFPAKLGCNHENLEMNHPRSGFEGLKMWWTLFKNLFKDNFKTKFGSYCELSQNGWSSPPKWEHNKNFWAEDDFESWDPGALWGLGGGGFPDCGKCIASLGFPKNPWLFPHESWQTGRDPQLLHPIWWGMQHHDNRLVKSRSIGSFFATHCGLGSHEQVYWDMSPRRLWHVTYTADLTIDLPWKKPGKMIFLLDMAMYGFHVINLGAVNAGECCRTSVEHQSDLVGGLEQFFFHILWE